MTGRALLNLIETDLLDGLDGDARAQVAWSIRDPQGFAAEKDREKHDTLLAAGGEVG